MLNPLFWLVFGAAFVIARLTAEGVLSLMRALAPDGRGGTGSIDRR